MSPAAKLRLEKTPCAKLIKFENSESAQWLTNTRTTYTVSSFDGRFYCVFITPSGFKLLFSRVYYLATAPFAYAAPLASPVPP